VRIGEDPWIGCKGNYRLFDALIRDLQLMGIYALEDGTSIDGRNVLS
jgi:hypothetical protein